MILVFYLYTSNSLTQVQDMKNMSRIQWNLQLKINQTQNKTKLNK